MPGSFVRDTLAPDLLVGATLNAAGTTNGTVTEVDRPQGVRATLTMGTVTGTTPTIDVEIQSADDLAFTVNVVSHGRFSAGTTANSATGVVRYLDVLIRKRYARAIVTLGGTTPVFTGTTCKLNERFYKAAAVNDTA